MNKKLSFKKLEEKIRILEKEVMNRKHNLLYELMENKEEFGIIFENASDLYLYTRMDGTIINVNRRLKDIFNYKRGYVVQKNILELGLLGSDLFKNQTTPFSKFVTGRQTQPMELKTFHKNGTPLYIEANFRLIKENNFDKGVLIFIRNITKRKHAEKALLEHRDHLEELVRDRTSNLAELNTALKVLLDQRDRDKIELEEKILFNVRELVLPYFERLKKSKMDSSQKASLDIIETNLNNIISPFSHRLSTKFMKLTHTEVLISNYVKHGKSTKEIADLMNLSANTIESYRKQIRKKMGIRNQKANLRTFLLTIQ